MPEQKTVAFFRIQGKKKESDDGSTWSFVSGISFSSRVASQTKKGKLLEAEAQKLLESDAMIVPVTVLKSRSVDNENYADKDATETTCGLLKIS